MGAEVSSIERTAAGIKSNAVLDFLRKPKQLLINGRWVPAKSGKTFETINPAIGRELGKHSIELYTQIKSVYLKL